MDGYAPLAAYLGQEGYCLELELRAGSQHCQKGTPAFLQGVRARARQLTAALLLVRLDGGNDAIENIAVVEAHSEQHAQGAPAHYLIKWNPGQESPEHWLAHAEEHGRETRTHDGDDNDLRRVMRVIQRTIDKHGQRLLVPEIELEGWTSLELGEESVIALYADHGTSEQYRSAFKTDLDIERLPSGKFATNALVLACALLAYHILRWIGQNGLFRCPAAPSREAPAHPYRHAVADVPSGATDPHRPPIEARVRL